MSVSNDSTSNTGYTSLEYSCNHESQDKSKEVVKRNQNEKKSITFQRHSVHQINLSKKVQAQFSSSSYLYMVE